MRKRQQEAPMGNTWRGAAAGGADLSLISCHRRSWAQRHSRVTRASLARHSRDSSASKPTDAQDAHARAPTNLTLRAVACFSSLGTRCLSLSSLSHLSLISLSSLSHLSLSLLMPQLSGSSCHDAHDQSSKRNQVPGRGQSRLSTVSYLSSTVSYLNPNSTPNATP